MRRLLDSAVLIDQLRGDPRAVTFLKSSHERGDELWSVTVVRTEIFAGMRPAEESATRHLLDRLHWMPVTADVADLAGEFARRYRRSHPGIDVVDFLVAAAAQSAGASLATTNVKHFPMFPHLAPAYR